MTSFPRKDNGELFGVQKQAQDHEVVGETRATKNANLPTPIRWIHG